MMFTIPTRSVRVSHGSASPREGAVNALVGLRAPLSL